MAARKISELNAAKLKIKELRDEIDEIDAGIATLFSKRLDYAAAIAVIKNNYNLPAMDYEREREILARACTGYEPDKAGYMRTLFSAILEVSKFYQSKKIT